MSTPTTLPAWQELSTLASTPQPHLRDRIQEAGREQRMQASAAGTGIRLDFSRQALDGATWNTRNGSTAWAPGGAHHPVALNANATVNSGNSWADWLL